MRDLHSARADRLRLQGIAISTLALLAASTLPAVSYYYIFQHDGMALGPFAWTHWAIVGATCALAILAHALGSTELLAAHVALGGMLGAGLGAFDTSFWFTLSTSCTTSQVAFEGCLNCACATTNSCTIAGLAADPLCSSCTAYPTEVCGPAQQQAQKFILAFTGLAALLLLALPVFYSMQVLCCLHASAAATAAKRHMVGFQVDTQTGLVESGEKPSVTPAMLAAWVGYLMDTEEQDCKAIGEKCRAALSARGFDLPVVQKKKKPAASSKGLFSKKGGGKKGTKEIAARAGSGLPPAGEAIAAAEEGEAQAPGRNLRKGRQVAADDRRVQFVQG